jgi:hypothetical protein
MGFYPVRILGRRAARVKLRCSGLTGDVIDALAAVIGLNVPTNLAFESDGNPLARGINRQTPSAGPAAGPLLLCRP